MGGAQSCLVASLSACSLYSLYVYIYSSHKLLQTDVLSSDRLPSLVYLSIRYLVRAVARRTGRLCAVSAQRSAPRRTLLGCRLDDLLLRRFCSSAGYGWDYPDTEYRDIPLCFPELLCCRLLLVVLTDGSFRLSPAGLVRVRQTLKTLQPVDELKKGPFTLQVRVLEYRLMDAGVEVDICLSATARTGCLVWESVLTLLSKDKLHTGSRCSPRMENESKPDEPVPENVRQVELRVPRTSGLQYLWSFSDYSPCRLLFLPARLFGCRSQTASSLWMLSVCLAEIEKHKGVGVITAPINITAHFKEPPLAPGRVTIRFWETTKNEGQSSAQSLSFHMQQHGGNMSHMMGQISRQLVNTED